jgi:ERCC4-type nuclease
MSKPIMQDVYEPEYFRKALNDLVDVVALPTADWAWIGAHGESIGIERKDTGDLLNSFQNGRLTDQLTRLTEQFNWPILIIEGHLSATADGMCKINYGGAYQVRSFRYDTIQLMLLEAQMSGVFIVHTNHNYGTGVMIRALYEFSQRAEHNLLNRRIRPFQLGTRVDEQVFLLMGLPGVGEDSARGLITTFGSPFNAMAGLVANEKLALTVKGIGKNKLARARQVLMKKPSDNNVESS